MFVKSGSIIDLIVGQDESQTLNAQCSLINDEAVGQLRRCSFELERHIVVAMTCAATRMVATVQRQSCVQSCAQLEPRSDPFNR